jgi:hypothetical protein
VSPCNEQLNRECSLFSEDGRFVLVGSAAFVPEDPHPPFFSVYQNNESVTPNPRNYLEDYTLYVVDILCGRLVDKTTFKMDKIVLSHNQVSGSISLYGTYDLPLVVYRIGQRSGIGYWNTVDLMETVLWIQICNSAWQRSGSNLRNFFTSSVKKKKSLNCKFDWEKEV